MTTEHFIHLHLGNHCHLRRSILLLLCFNGVVRLLVARDRHTYAGMAQYIAIDRPDTDMRYLRGNRVRMMRFVRPEIGWK